MKLFAKAASLDDILPWRDMYCLEMSCQIIHDSIHSRPGWIEEFHFYAGEVRVGYGSMAIAGPWKGKPTFMSSTLCRSIGRGCSIFFAELLKVAGAVAIETQSNDPLLTVLLYTFATSVTSESILFHDKLTTTLAPAGAVFRRATAAEFPEISTDQLKWHGVVESEGKVAATGGILFHYNRPYGDIYMNVAEPFRRCGLGSYLVQELKRVCYEGGNIPAARCNPKNVASRGTLQKSGFVPCGHILTGSISS